MSRSNFETMLGEEQKRPEFSKALDKTLIFIINAYIAAGIIDKGQAIAMLEGMLYDYLQNSIPLRNEVGKSS